ncbi:glutathione S-transferase family protein [Paenirhodobacter sp.]|jgi:glutathione S-transferase|uniref:glutathione S-transferase family protein n=1 Tax=Paenirhodobacter sp. TaxID=1965326 RepID=UPI003B507E97
MILYDYVLSPDCYAVRLMAALTGQRLDIVPVDAYPGHEEQGLAFREINPAGTIPVLVDGGLTLTEPVAILLHLARAWRGNALEAEWLARSRHFAATLGAARAHDMLCQPGDIDALRRDGVLWLRILEAALFEAPFLAGDRVTVADIAVFPHVALAPDGGVSLDPYPRIRLWMRALRALPGFIEMPGIHRLHDLKPEPGPEFGGDAA